MNRYILDGKIPVREPDLIKWANWFESSNRIVAKDEVNDCRVSTVFLAVDHAFMGGIPTLFETMIFGGKFDGFQERYGTWREAEESHNRIVQELKDGAFRGDE